MVNPTRIYLVRHAKPLGGENLVYDDDITLDPATPAQHFAATAAKLPDGAVWGHSGAVRAAMTMDALLAYKQAPIVNSNQALVIHGLVEQRWGTWFGKHHADLLGDSAFVQISKRRDEWADLAPPAARGLPSESFNMFATRVGQHLDRAADLVEHLAGAAPPVGVFACHGGTQRAALMHAEKMPAEVVIGQKFPHLGVLVLERDSQRRWHVVQRPGDISPR